MKNLILATTLALTMLTAAVGSSLAATDVVPDKVLGIIVTNEIVGDKVVWTLVTDPVRLPVDECLIQADRINNSKEIPYTMMCMPEIRPALTPAI